MRKIERLWIKAIEQGIDDKLINLLAQLSILNREVWRHYMQSSHEILMNYRNERAAKKNRSEVTMKRNSHYSQSIKAIKPTKQRRW